MLSDYGPELAQHFVQPGWAAIPIINLYAFYASTLWRLGDYESGHGVCDLAYDILSKVDHPYSRLLIDTVQGQIWIEEEKLDCRTGICHLSVCAEVCDTSAACGAGFACNEAAVFPGGFAKFEGPCPPAFASAALTTISPGAACCMRRAARFTSSPITV